MWFSTDGGFCCEERRGIVFGGFSVMIKLLPVEMSGRRPHSLSFFVERSHRDVVRVPNVRPTIL